MLEKIRRISIKAQKAICEDCQMAEACSSQMNCGEHYFLVSELSDIIQRLDPDPVRIDKNPETCQERTARVRRRVEDRLRKDWQSTWIAAEIFNINKF